MASRLSPRDVAAYLLDRAHEYENESPCWIALADAAHNVIAGEVMAAKDSGELTPDLYRSVDAWVAKPGPPRSVHANAGVDDVEDDEAEAATSRRETGGGG